MSALGAPISDTGSIAARSSSELRLGAMSIAPLIVGYAPYAFVVGSAIGAGRSPVAGWAGTWLIFGGSAHLATLRALDDGSALLAVITGLLVQARLVVYSASLGAHWRGQPRWFRVAAAALIIDPTWLVAERRAGEPGTPQDHRRFFLGAGLTLGAAWCALVTSGMVVGSHVGSSIGLEVAVPLCLLALVAGRVRDRRIAPAVVTAGVVAALTSAFPAGSGLLVAIVAGAAVGRVPGRDRS